MRGGFEVKSTSHPGMYEIKIKDGTTVQALVGWVKRQACPQPGPLHCVRLPSGQVLELDDQWRRILPPEYEAADHAGVGAKQ